MIVHTWAKHYREDCFSYSISVFDCHITVKCDLASSEKYKNHCLFCKNVTWMRILASKCHRNTIARWYAQTAKKLLQAQNTQDYKRLFFTLQSLLCKFKIYKSRLNHVGSLKIDKRDKLLKVNVLSDAEWLFGVTPKETCSKNNVILHKKSDWGLQSSQKWNNSTSLDSSPV